MPDERDPRVLLAIERTFLAWTRTALALMGFGFVVARMGLLLRDFSGVPTSAVPQLEGTQSVASAWLGTGLVVLGILVQGFALVERQHLVRRFRKGESLIARGGLLPSLTGIALVAIGIALVIYLVTL